MTNLLTTDPGERIKNLVAKFVLKYNYWGYLFSRIRRRAVPKYDSIMGVQIEPYDGSITLNYEPDLVRGTEDKELQKIIEHEGMHLLNKHLPRLLRILAHEIHGLHPLEQKSRIDVWNIASDCAVNQQIGLTQPVIVNGTPWPPQLPAKYKMPDDKTTEYYYKFLLKNLPKKYFSDPGWEGDGSGKNQAFDNHEGWKNAKGTSDMSALSRKVDNHIVSLIKESVKTFNKDRGHLPNHIARLIESALGPPQVPYYQLIKKLVKGTRLSKFKRSFTRINRKRTYVFNFGDIENIPIISPFPGKARDFSFVIAVVLDTSGSMGPKEIREGLSGIKHIIEKDKYCKTTVVECDAAVQKVYECKRVRDIDFKPKGGGGTVLFPGLVVAKEHHPDVCLVFTDGYCDNINAIPRKELPRKLIWVINGSPDQVNKTGYVVRI